MDIQDQHAVNQAPPAQGAVPVNHARRRFARAGLGASGVILTLASQPGMAATRVCKSPSGSLSGGLQSRPADQEVKCLGMTPEYWATNQNAWKGAYPVPSTQPAKPATTFAAVFPGGTGVYATYTLLQMLTAPLLDDPSDLGKHLAACYLNIKADKINYLTVESLQRIWRELLSPGYYTPIAGTQWSADQVSLYLQSTEGV